MLRIFRDSGNRLAIVSLALMGLIAVLQHWLFARRPAPPELRASREIVVTSSEDRGPGSLREAIFAADTAQGRARIVLRVGRIILHSPLPPIVNPRGVALDAGPQDGEIDAQGIGSGPVIDISAPNSVVNGLKVANAPEQAILVRAGGFHLTDARIGDCHEGLHAIEGVKNLEIDGTAFEKNRLGITLASTSSEISIHNNQFSHQQEAAIWAVQSPAFYVPQAPRLTVRKNSFDGDHMSLVLGNTPAVIESNDFVNASEAALFLIGQGATVRGNRIRNGRGVGIFADRTQGTIIETNEIDHNQTIGVLIRSSRNDVVRNNRIYNNGYGLALVLGQPRDPTLATDNTLLGQQVDGIVVIGDSPVVRQNRVLESKLAGLNILDFVPRAGPRVRSNPYVVNNSLEGNKWNEPRHGEYRVRGSSD